MGQEEFDLLVAAAKYVLPPAIGFFAGFIAKWFLQERKSRADLVQALSSKRADALLRLWAITTLRPQITSLGDGVALPPDLLKPTNAAIMKWYAEKGGALFLSWQATSLVFRLLDTLRDEKTQKKHLENAVSALRTRLKYDCGIYSFWDAARQIDRPRPSRWLTRNSNRKLA